MIVPPGSSGLITISKDNGAGLTHIRSVYQPEGGASLTKINILPRMKMHP
jgi:hypothetical protein